MATKKVNFYRLHTNVPNMDLYMVNENPAWQEILKKGKEGKLGNIPGTNYPITPEMKHTEEMILSTYVDSTDEEGDIDTEDKEFAKYIFMSLKHYAAVPHYEETDVSKAIPKYMAYFRKVLDKNSPTDVLDDLEKELTIRLSPGARREALEKKRLEARQSK